MKSSFLFVYDLPLKGPHFVALSLLRYGVPWQEMCARKPGSHSFQNLFPGEMASTPLACGPPPSPRRSVPVPSAASLVLLRPPCWCPVICQGVHLTLSSLSFYSVPLLPFLDPVFDILCSVFLPLLNLSHFT